MATLAAWCRPRRPTRVGPRRGQLDVDAVAVPAEQRGRLDHGQRHAETPRAPADDRQPVTARAGHGEVAALDDRGLLAGDLGDRVAQPVHVVEVHVRHDGHASIPRVGRVEPTTQPDLDEGDVGSDLREAGEDDRGQQLEFGRVAVAAGDAVGHRQDATDEAGEVVGTRSVGRRPGSARGT